MNKPLERIAYLNRVNTRTLYWRTTTYEGEDITTQISFHVGASVSIGVIYGMTMNGSPSTTFAPRIAEWRLELMITTSKRMVLLTNDMRVSQSQQDLQRLR